MDRFVLIHSMISTQRQHQPTMPFSERVPIFACCLTLCSCTSVCYPTTLRGDVCTTWRLLLYIAPYKLAFFQTDFWFPRDLSGSIACLLQVGLHSYICPRELPGSYELCPGSDCAVEKFAKLANVPGTWVRGAISHSLLLRVKLLTAPADCRGSSVTLVNRVELGCFISLCKMQI
jgi:hypothetical protein